MNGKLSAASENALLIVVLMHVSKAIILVH